MTKWMLALTNVRFPAPVHNGTKLGAWSALLGRSHEHRMVSFSSSVRLLFKRVDCRGLR